MLDMIKQSSNKVKGSLCVGRQLRTGSHKEETVREGLRSKESSRQTQNVKQLMHRRIIKQSTVPSMPKMHSKRFKSCILDPKVCSTHMLMEFWDCQDGSSKKENEVPNLQSMTFSTTDESTVKERPEFISHGREHVVDFNPLNEFLCFGKSPISEFQIANSDMPFLDLNN